ncbi:hypothetical protein [Caproiciproducens galactitolivorans]|uniref:tRNA nuclease CdiA C-terminal domain-containing protein n=1 Tax=Caproiciproducens galactitolivorans TaxID=642589 RepID=A0ABT4BV49_9FIRM|nr:hypothetical protein [Caproiciproducens galactitolivorans]MCY1714749.1 hypothetical protein [Caproiciproducens galactitolivorans]
MVTGIAIAAVVVAGPELMVISVCTVVGGGIGGITEGIESVQNGGTFIDGFSDGFMWGSIGGFASGAVIVSGAGLVASSYAGGAIDSAVYAGRCIQDGRTVTAEGVVGNFVTGAAVWAGGTLIRGKVAKRAEEKLAKSVIDEVTTAGNPEIISKEAEEVIEGGSTSFEITPEIRTALKTEPNTAFFWSGNTEGVGGAEIAANIAKNKNGVTLESTIANKNIDIPKWDFDNPMSIKAWEDASAAYADQVSGEIRAVVGENLRPNNIWENVELPKLIGNENVCKITIIDPKTGIETIIYGGK